MNIWKKLFFKKEVKPKPVITARHLIKGDSDVSREVMHQLRKKINPIRVELDGKIYEFKVATLRKWGYSLHKKQTIKKLGPIIKLHKDKETGIIILCSNQ